MQKPHVPQILISSAAIVGISIVWYDFNVKVFQSIFDLIEGTFYDKAAERARRIKEIEEEIRIIEEEAAGKTD